MFLDRKQMPTCCKSIMTSRVWSPKHSFPLLETLLTSCKLTSHGKHQSLGLLPVDHVFRLETNAYTLQKHLDEQNLQSEALEKLLSSSGDTINRFQAEIDQLRAEHTESLTQIANLQQVMLSEQTSIAQLRMENEELLQAQQVICMQ